MIYNCKALFCFSNNDNYGVLSNIIQPNPWGFWLIATSPVLLYLVVMFFVIKNYRSGKKSKNKGKVFLILGFLLFVLFMATSGSTIVFWVYLLGALLGIGLSIKRVDKDKPNDL